MEGANRLLFFVAHGVGDRNHRVESVKYGDREMYLLEGRSQDRNDRASVSVWYLKEAEIASAIGTGFTVDWYRKPGDRSFESIFFTNASQVASLGSTGEAGCNDCFALECPAETIEPGHISLYTGTHERDGVTFFALNGYSQDIDVGMGGNGKATIGHKEGNGDVEFAGAEFGREGAFSMVCYEVQDIPQTASDTD